MTILAVFLCFTKMKMIWHQHEIQDI